VLHRFFEKHADKVGKELLSLSKPSAEGDSSAIKGQQAWASLCSALVDLGAPIEVPRLSILPSSQHRDYLELLNRNDRHSVSSVREIFVETFTDKVNPALYHPQFSSYSFGLCRMSLPCSFCLHLSLT
jgi:hypothetical protein